MVRIQGGFYSWSKDGLYETLGTNYVASDHVLVMSVILLAPGFPYIDRFSNHVGIGSSGQPFNGEL